MNNKGDIIMDPKFVEVMKYEGPATIVTVNGHPASVVNTWMSYIKVNQAGNYLLIPAAGMRSIEHDFEKDNHVTLTMGTKEVEGQSDQVPATTFMVLVNSLNQALNSMK